MAHAVAPLPGGSIERNLIDATSYLGALNRVNGRRLHVIAPWISLVRAMGNGPEDIEHGMEIDFRVIRMCRGVIGVGWRWSDGMRMEAETADEAGLVVIDAVGCAPGVAAEKAAKAIKGLS